MSKTVVIYNTQSVFAGPSPCDSYHFINSRDGLLSNTGDINLLQPLHRIQEVSYSISNPNSNISQLGRNDTINRFISDPPNISLNISYLINGVGNESKLGFYVDYFDTYNTGAKFGGNNQFLFSGLVSRSLNKENNNIKWPAKYRDKRNIFIGVTPQGVDFNNRYFSDSHPYSGQLSVYGFGNCYITNYGANYSVGQFPVANLSFSSENINFYTSGFNNEIPCIEAKNGKNLTGKYFNIPSSFEGSNNTSVLLPTDMRLTISTSSAGIVNNLSSFNSQNAQNFFTYSEDLTSNNWNKTGLSGNINFITGLNPLNVTGNNLIYNTGFITQTVNINPASGTKIVFSLWAKSSGVATGIGLRIDRNGIGQNNYKTYPISTNWTKIYHTGQLDQNNSNLQARIDIFSGTYIYGPQIYYSGYSNNYIPTFDTPYIQNSGDNNISNIGYKQSDIKVQSFSFNIPISREPIRLMGYKRPIDYVPNLPIIGTFNTTFVVGDNESGSIINLLKNNDDCNFKFEVNQPRNFSPSGTAIIYDFRKCKLSSLQESNTIGPVKLVNAQYYFEMVPNRQDQGLFMSGLLNYVPQYSFKDYLLQSNGFKILQSNGSSLLIRNSNIVF